MNMSSLVIVTKIGRYPMKHISSHMFQQLLCLSLQLMANLALDPVNHDALLATELVDSLIQLILPSDEW